MTERFSLDANILVYTADSLAGGRQGRAIDILDAAIVSDCVLTVQAIAEFYHATTRKRVLKRGDAATKVEELSLLFEIVGPNADALRAAVAEARMGRFSIWDALLLATVEQAGCTLLLSEDMADGGRFGAVSIVNPFAASGLPKRAAAALGL